MPIEDTTSDDRDEVRTSGPRDRDERTARTTDSSATIPIDRRDYLRSVGIAGALGALGGVAGPTTGSVVAQSDWEAEADQRIAEHRQGTLKVRVVDESGQPVPDADVDVEMQEHDYWFGNALSADLLVNETEPGHPYRESLRDDFNIVWFGNYHKWRFFEDNLETANRATAWAKDNGLDIRGHTCLWANVSAWAVPGDVVDAMGVDHESGQNGPNLDPDHVRERSFDHIQDIIEHYADFEYDGESYGSVIEEWEVMNEVVHEPGLIRAVNGIPADQEDADLDPVTEPVLAEWYQHARDVAPDDVGLAANDYNTMEGSLEDTRSDYERQIEFLAENGHLDYVGVQSHFGEQSTAVTPQETMDVLDRYAQHGVRLRVTEFDMTGDDWSDEEKADFFHDYLKTVFSHEATDAFLIAGGSDEHHWREDAPFFYEDWSPKPAYDVYQDLVFDEWWTEESGTTDDDGTVTTSPFLGDHEITVTVDGETTTETVSVTDAGSVTEAVVTVNGPETPEECTEDEIAIADGDYCAADLDGDGIYRDVDGSETIGSNDVVVFFEHFEDSAAIQQNAEAFDFADTDSLGVADVVALFQQI